MQAFKRRHASHRQALLTPRRVKSRMLTTLLSAMLLGLGLASTSYAQIEIPTCNSKADGECKKFSSTTDLITILLSTQGWGDKTTKGVGIWNNQKGQDNNQTVIVDFESSRSVEIIRGAEAYTTESFGNVDSSDNSNLTGNKLYIKINPGVTTTVHKENWDGGGLGVYSYGGDVAGAFASSGSAQNNAVYIKGTLTSGLAAIKGTEGSLDAGMIVGAGIHMGNRSSAVQLNGNRVEIEDAVIKPANAKESSGIYAVYGYFPHDSSHDAQASNNTTVISNSHIQVASIGAYHNGSVNNSGTTNSLTTENNQVQISNSTLDMAYAHYSTMFGIFASQNEGDQGKSSGDGIAIKDSQLNITLGADRYGFSLWAIRYGTRAVGGTITLENTKIDITAQSGGTGVFSLLVGQSRVQTDEQVLTLKNSHITTTDSSRMGIISASQLSTNNTAVSGKTQSEMIKPASGSQNKILVSGSTIGGGGMYAVRYIDQTDGSVDSSGIVFNNNVIDISSSKIGLAKIVGAMNVANGTAQNNKITIGAQVTDMNGGVLTLDELSGAIGNNAAKTFIGNSLSVASPIVTKSMKGFQNFEFVANANWDASTPFVHVTENPVPMVVDEKSGIDLTNIMLTGELPEGSSELCLIKADKGFVNLTDNQPISEGEYEAIKGQDIAIKRAYSLVRVSNDVIDGDSYSLAIEAGQGGNGEQDLILSLDNGSSGGGNVPIVPPPSHPELNDQANILLDASLSALASLWANDDLIMQTARQSEGGYLTPTFAAVRGQHQKLTATGTIDVDGAQALIGVTKATAQQTHVSAWLETGYSTYDTDAYQTQGEGDHNYVGVGVYVHKTLLQSADHTKALSVQGYGKLGWIRNRFDVTLNTVPVTFDRQSVYWGAMAGLSYDWLLTPKVLTRTYLHYLYDGRQKQSYDQVGQKGVEGAHFDLAPLNAHRLMLGSQWTYRTANGWQPYVDVAYEAVIKAAGKGQVRDSKAFYDLKQTNLEGSTGRLGLGVRYQSESKAWQTELSCLARVGAQEEVGLQAQVLWNW